MKRYSFVLKILLAVMTPAILSGQDIHFSQYTYSPLTLNPALTCAYKDLQVTLQFKDQWRMVSAYRTAAVTFEMKGNQMPWLKVEKMTSIYKKKLARGLAFGLHVFSDKAGDGNMAQTQGNFSLAYHALLNQNHTLSAGLMGGFVQRSISPDGLRFNNQYTGGIYNPAILPGENFINQTYVYGDYSAGLLWSYGEGSRYLTANDQRHINAGVSVAHINNPPQSFLGNTEARLYRKWTAHAGSLLGISNTKYSV
ncbi:MAG TPA: PorP/SprF family type IX secretion system membrane protein, partial [Bacteroidia bacterium]|nr:PorP/SprF family type IX secretion system membrane protein [Bacteroidia bacterium]